MGYKLTDVSIKKRAKPADKPFKLTDGSGLYLLVTKEGGRLWRYDYKNPDGKRKTLSLGKYPDVSLALARERHREARELLARDIDPVSVKKAQKAAKVERAANSFEVIAREWFDNWKKSRVESHSSKVIARLEKDVFPWLGRKPISEIRLPDVLAVCKRIEGRGVIETAHRAYGNISQVMGYAVATGRADRNPCLDARGILQPVPTKHFAAILEPAKVAELLRAIDNYPGTYQVRAALRLAPMFFVRPGELRQAKWADFDLDRAEWKYITPKTKTEHLVPLSRQAVEILKELHQLTGSGEYVFSGIRPGRPLSNMTLNRALQTMGYDTKTEMTAHGFRAMARTLLAERLNERAEVIEHQLAHKVPDTLGAAYNRTKFLDQRRIMMQEWSDYLEKLKTGPDCGHGSLSGGRVREKLGLSP